MSEKVAMGLGVAALLACGTLALGQAPASKGQAPAAPAAKAAASASAPAAKAAASDPILATVNNEAIRQSEVVKLLAQFSVPPGSEEKAYSSAMDLLVNTRLLAQFLKAQKTQVAPADIDQVVAQYDQAAKANNSSLAGELATNGTSMEEFRERIERTLQWQKFVTAKATEEELKAYAEKNKDLLTGAQVRASHILVRVASDAAQAEKDKAKQKLVEIKKLVESGELTFADAANKHSEDPGNQQTPAGGDLNFFPRKGMFIEPFSAAAFGLAKGVVSDPVETEYGYHLIQVTDRKEGQPVDFAKARDQILAQYAAELQETIVNAERKKAEAAQGIKTAPMPPGLVKAEVQPITPAATPGTSAETPKAGATKAAAPAAPVTKPAAPATKPAAPKS